MCNKDRIVQMDCAELANFLDKFRRHNCDYCAIKKNGQCWAIYSESRKTCKDGFEEWLKLPCNW